MPRKPPAGTPGSRLKALRSERGLSLRKLAVLAGVSFANLSLYERDLKPFSLEMACRLADAMGADRARLDSQLASAAPVK